MMKEFKEFAIKGDALELAVGVVIGAAFSQVVNSLVNDILNPFLSLFTGHVDFGNLKFSILGHAIRYGAFLNASINFIVVAFAVYILIRRIVRIRHKPVEVPEMKSCQYCKSLIDTKAVRCPFCTSQLE